MVIVRVLVPDICTLLLLHSLSVLKLDLQLFRLSILSNFSIYCWFLYDYSISEDFILSEENSKVIFKTKVHFLSSCSCENVVVLPLQINYCFV